MIKAELHEKDVKLSTTKYLGTRFFEYKDILNKYNAHYITRQGVRYNLLALSKASAFLEEVEGVGFTVVLSDELSKRLTHSKLEDVVNRSNIDKMLKKADKILKKKGLSIRSYQRDDAKTLYAERTHLLCNPVGSGKTMTALHSIPPDFNVIIVSPAGVRLNWGLELEKWGMCKASEVNIVKKKSATYPQEDAKYTVFGYSTVPPDTSIGTLELTGYTCLILDEVHYIKNKKAKRSKAVTKLIKKVQANDGMVLGLTATPLLNKPQELYNILDALNLVKKTFGNWQGFLREFRGYKGQWGYIFNGPTPDVPKILSKAMIMRKREDIIEELPDYTHQVVSIPTPRGLIKQIAAEIEKDLDLEGFVEEALNDRRATAFDMLSRCRSILSQAKVKSVIEELQTYIDSEEPVVVCTTSVAAAEAIQEGLPKDYAGVITGKVNGDRREAIRQDFFNGKINCLVVTIASSNTGVDFTKASHMIFVDQDFVPAQNLQMRGRIDRLTQQAKALVYKYVVTDHPIDKLVHRVLMDKQALLDETFRNMEV